MVSRWIRCASTALIGSVLFCGAALSAPPVKNTPPTVTLTSPASGALYSSPASITLSANAADANGTISKVDFFRGTTLIASVAAAPYSFVWSNVAAGSYSITAKATDNGGATATSNAAAITVSSAPAASIVITSPVAGSSVNQLVDVAGTFSGAADTTVLVYNGNNNTVLGTVTGNEFLAKNVPLAPGNNTITATSVRRDGLSATTLVPVTVPYLLAVLTSPPKNSFHDLPASLTFQASAVVANGSIQRVEYYSGANLLGSAITAPYNFVWSNPTIGSHSLYARVVDNAGISQSSNAVNVTVRGLNQLPTVSLTSPASGALFSSPASFTLQAAATDSDGTIASVEFLQNGAFLGATNVAPYSFALSNVAQGSYTFTARATDNRGGVAVSSPVTVTVTRPNNSPAVNLTSPQVNASYIAPASVALSATATDSDGMVTRVEFYAGNVLVATATTAPCTATWAVSTPGSYSISAKAFDDLGASTVSSAVKVTVGDGVTYLHNDFPGNPIAATDTSGAVIWKENFRPYGDRLNNQAAAAGNRIGFHGKAVDTETGLSYFGARYYDPSLGRFMGVDPVGFKEENLHSFNRYAYGNNNPYRYIDPNGMWAEDLVLAILGLVVGSKSLVDNFRSGNYSGAAVDALGMIADGAALAVPGVPGGVGLGIKASREAAGLGAKTGAESTSSALKLKSQLASESQMAEVGQTMTGAGALVPFRDSARVAKEHGGNAIDWVKKTSSNYSDGKEKNFETHWVENTQTGQRAEFKTKFTD